MFNRNLTVANVLNTQRRVYRLSILLEKKDLPAKMKTKLDKELFWLERKMTGR